MDNKVNYQMYKSGKVWLFSSVLAVGTMLSVGGSASADSIQETDQQIAPNSELVKISNDTSKSDISEDKSVEESAEMAANVQTTKAEQSTTNSESSESVSTLTDKTSDTGEYRRSGWIRS